MGEAFHGLHEQGAVTVAAPGPALQAVETLHHLLAFPLQRGKALHALHEQDAVGRAGHAAGGGPFRGRQGLHLSFQMGETFHGLHEQGRVAVDVPGLGFQGTQAPVELAAAFFQAADALQAFRKQGSFGAGLPGQSGQMQARITDHGRGGIQPGFPVPGGGHVPGGGRRGRRRLMIRGRQQEQVVRGRGRRRRGLVGQGKGLRRFGAVFRQVGAFFDKVRQFDDLVLLGRYGHGRLTCRMVGDPGLQRLALHSSSCSKRQTAKKKSRGFPRLAVRKWMTAYGWHLDLAQPVRSFFRSGFSATTLT